jgi:hypothetical protein
MKLLLNRRYKGSKYTIGTLYVNNEWFSDTLEDPDRGLSDNMPELEISFKKVYGKTAIPTGTYKIDMDIVSLKFKNRSWAIPYSGKVPRLLNVKGFDGIIIHPLNTAEESLGCIGVGRNTQKGKILNSTLYFNKLMKLLLEAKNNNEEITITII